jgi:ribosome biogenesis GTPase
MKLTIEQLGWTEAHERDFAPYRAKGLVPARVAIEDKHFYRLYAEAGPLTGQCSGKQLFESKNSSTLPKVGDWIAITPLLEEGKATIHEVLPRKSSLSRKLTGRDVEEQILVTNIDKAFVVQALDKTFNIPRLERMLVMVREGGAKPVIVLNKLDLCDDPKARMTEAKKAAGDAPVLTTCGLTGRGVKAIQKLIGKKDTVVFFGTSGVGKSTLINDLYGEDVLPVGEVRENDAKGRHVTTWRELIALPQGGLVIDTPGMREFYIWLAEEGLNAAFADIESLAVKCHFRDCSHTKEKKCAVLDARTAGTIDEERYQSFIKLTKEQTFLKEVKRQKNWKTREKSSRVAHRVFNKGS